MNNVFEEVKQRANILQVCDMLGLKLNRSHQCLCPFHNEKSPSFSIHPEKGIYYCFGCGEKGDAISLVGKMYNVKPLEAAKIINNNLGLGLSFNENKKNTFNGINKYKQKQKVKDEFAKWENHTIQTLCDYYQILLKWAKYDWETDFFLEAANNLDYIDNIIDDIFINGTNEDKIWYWKNKRKEVSRIESRVRYSRAINQ